MDITSRKRTEDALRRTEKLAAAGRLAATISHEINNPLESVINLLYLMDSQPGLNGQAREYLALAQQELARITQITTQTLGFYRQSTRATEVYLADIIDSVLKLYASRLHHAHIDVEQHYWEVRPFFGFSGELRQVFMNLVGNAMDSMRPGGGRLLVRCAQSRDWKTGHQGIRVSIADTGHGIAAKTMASIFEPFFTTKENTGTGLGLWITLEIVQKHQGTISVRSRAHGSATGTVFSVFVPYAPSQSRLLASQLQSIP
jgi:signal transduction histidine kinase